MIRSFQSKSPSAMDRSQLETSIIQYFSDRKKRRIHIHGIKLKNMLDLDNGVFRETLEERKKRKR